jgi:hypothetical protein
MSANQMDDLEDWWMEHAADEAQMVIPKAISYGADDLLQIGRQMAGAIHREVTDAQAAELGIAFYAYGKIARIMAAVKEGRDPNIDSWLDLGVYAKMAQRVRTAGGWPGNITTEGDDA